MKKYILITVLFLVNLGIYAQVPSNDCGESPIIVNACGTAFSTTQSQMSNATNGATCSSGGSCPIVYVNGLGYDNFDCNTGTAYNGSASGDDFSGSIENSLWWSFLPDETCSYDITITATNCCCKDKGSSNSAQYAIFDTDGALPGGTIQNYLSSNGAFTGTQSPTISVTQGQPVFIVLDGVNGTDCDISVSISPSTNCVGCLILPITLVDFRVFCDVAYWATGTEKNNDYFLLEGSSDGESWEILSRVEGNGTSNFVRYYQTPIKSFSGTNYYRLTQVDYDGIRSVSDILTLGCGGDEIEYEYYNILGQKVTEDYTGYKIRR